MAKSIILDEWHLTLRIPNKLADEQVEAIRQILASDDFLKRLRQGVRTTLGHFPELTVVRVTLSR